MTNKVLHILSSKREKKETLFYLGKNKFILSYRLRLQDLKFIVGGLKFIDNFL